MALHQDTFAEVEDLQAQIEQRGQKLELSEVLQLLQIKATLAVAEQLSHIESEMRP